MIKVKPSNPKGVRDFLPAEQERRQYIIQILQKHFELFGYQSIYTPSFERFETLAGKYGEEGDKLFFKILNSGNFLEKRGQSIIPELEQNLNAPQKTAGLVSEKGLRYDHTVPLARFVSQYQNELIFPFKRYAIGPVWRADRPQKGRYQEFFQCDIDIVGTSGVEAEIEIIDLIQNVYKALGIEVKILCNHKDLFYGLCKKYEIDSRQTDVATIIDKWEKIGVDEVRIQLNDLFESHSEQIDLFLNDISNPNLLDQIQPDNEFLKIGIDAINELRKFTPLQSIKITNQLVRGLDYYTGFVFEVVCKQMEYGSIGGGGRYDALTEVFGLKNMNGIGFSFGLDRIYDVMETLDLFPKFENKQHILVLNIDKDALSKNFDIVKKLREHGICAFLFPTLGKMDKQLSYADKMGISKAIIIGSEELKTEKVIIKNLKKRTQELVPFDVAIDKLLETE
jgi:histidyl-tRNA synthetase